jgi:hypothetical protein
MFSYSTVKISSSKANDLSIQCRIVSVVYKRKTKKILVESEDS